jgi:hypothetical protein
LSACKSSSVVTARPFQLVKAAAGCKTVRAFVVAVQEGAAETAAPLGESVFAGCQLVNLDGMRGQKGRQDCSAGDVLHV